MMSFDHDKITPLSDSDLTKKQQVADMFDSIAHKYDFLNRFLSAGIDKGWRKKALRELKDIAPQNILDVATGTADVAIMAEKMYHPQKITGIDISDGMLEIGRKKIAALQLSSKIELINGDSEKIPFEDNSFEAVTVAFGVRNFSYLTIGLEEILRVLKPGGKLVVLEFSKPQASLIKPFYSLYMEHIAPWVGKTFSKNKAAYQYLNESIKNFPEGEKFTQILKQTGYSNVQRKPLSMGICTIYCGQK